MFNQASLYKAYKKRTKTIQPDMEAYNAAKSSDPEFYRDDSSLKYGEVDKVIPVFLNFLFQLDADNFGCFRATKILRRTFRRWFRN